jgi:hypothetical protein
MPCWIRVWCSSCGADTPVRLSAETLFATSHVDKMRGGEIPPRRFLGGCLARRACQQKVALIMMKTIQIRIGNSFIPALLLTLLAAHAQEGPPGSKQAGAGQPTVARDKGKEDQVAKLFEGIRAGAKLPQMVRIRHRAELEQGICTSAVTGKPAKLTRAFYVTANPESITPELNKIASFSKLAPNNKPWFARYSVAVWRVEDPQAGEVTYWVGVGFYETALGEFVDCHFTDDVHYCGTWKKSIAPACRGK